MSRVTKKQIDEQLEVYFPSGYYDILRKKTLERLWKYFTFKHKTMKKITDKERLKLLEEQARLIESGNAGIDKQGKLVDMRKNKNAVPIPKH